VPGSSHHHPAPVQPGPTPAASLAARAEQRPGVRREPSRAVGTRIATSASVRTEKRTVDRRILVDDDWRRVGHVGAPFSSLFSLGGL
jgi:hypothetical protein